LKNPEQSFKNELFIRVHKLFIVSVTEIIRICGNEIFSSENRISISRNYRDQVISQVIANKLWDKIRFF